MKVSHWENYWSKEILVKYLGHIKGKTAVAIKTCKDLPKELKIHFL